ncbi:argininosuccinate lyase, partial [Candidatus Woesearchaeota archaeon CG11_big_fil_rev_8_21_14_0_20_57_5]
MKPLWDKGKKLDATVLDFTAGQDAILDTQLAYYDAIASCAHVKALAKAGLLSKPEAKTLVTKLAAIADKAADGKFAIDAEDCHSAIEQALGDMGKKVHLGRSRNDQAATAMRLYLKDMLLDAGSKQALLADMLQSMALKHKDTPMPGYSHTRKAMVSSVGHWLGSYAELLSLTVPRLGVIDLSPLGSASGFGTSATVDRTFEAKLLGFAGVQQNALGCQAGRVMAEAHACQQMLSIMTVLSQLAADIIFFSAEGIGYVKISPDIATGSSLMPN